MSGYDRIVLCDIDGCLNTAKHVALDLEALGVIRSLIRDLAATGTMFSLCTGRPQPYAEAMAQVLDLMTPFICENGAMIFDPETGVATGLVSLDNAEAMRKLRTHLTPILRPDTLFEPGNDYSLSVTGPAVIAMSDAGRAAYMDELQGMSGGFSGQFWYSNSAIDITSPGVSKRSGAEALLRQIGLSSEQVVAIGDGENDRPVLEMAGLAVCPANASPAIKDICDLVAKAPSVSGVIELLRRLL